MLRTWFVGEAGRGNRPIHHWRTNEHRDVRQSHSEPALGCIEPLPASDSVGRKPNALCQPRTSPHLGRDGLGIRPRELDSVGQSCSGHSGHIGHQMETPDD